LEFTATVRFVLMAGGRVRRAARGGPQCRAWACECRADLRRVLGRLQGLQLVPATLLAPRGGCAGSARQLGL